MFASTDWRGAYARRLLVTDTLVIVWVVFAVQFLRFGFDEASVPLTGSALSESALTVSYWLLSLFLVVAWSLTLGVFKTRDFRVVGAGSDEYKRVVDASVRLFGLVAIAAFVLKVDLARGYVLLAFPAGILVLLFTRWMWRQWLVLERRNGRFLSRLLLVGTPQSNALIAREFSRLSDAGYRVVGVWTPDPAPSVTSSPEMMRFDSSTPVVSAMAAAGADTVAISNSDVLGEGGVRELSWGLEPGRQHLIMTPNLTDVSGPRIQTRPVAGLPLVHVETPRYEGASQFSKRLFDIVSSGLAIVVLSPLMLVVAVLVKLTSRGPVLFRQERIGMNGKPFTMLKFRSMVVDAEDQLRELSDRERDAGNDVLFKLRDDPRVTPVGKFIRRFSIDELPQLLNILTGSMSVVGPRPPLPSEVATYDDHVHRRFLVKPGLTGLWQVSGRSSLSWEESVRLDLFYVENWSLTGDLVLIWRTLKAVVRRDGAF